MFKLIAAQGADHTTPERLQKIVNHINTERSRSGADIWSCQIHSAKLDKIMRYEPTFNLRSIRDLTPLIHDYVVEEKFDGFSYLNCDGRFFSKRLSAAKGNEGAPIEKTGHLPHLTSVLSKVYAETGCDLHGEVYIPGGISDDVTKILGCTEDEAVRRIHADWENRPRFMLIDLRAYKGNLLIDEPYYVRRAILEFLYYNYIAGIDTNHDICLAPILHEDPRYEFKRIVNSGGEGIIIKKTSAKYCAGKKPVDNWIKGKKKITHDVVIMDLNGNGTGKNASMFGSIKFGHYVDGKLVVCGNCSSGLDDGLRANMAANPQKYIGSVMEISAIQESVKSFRNAVFLRMRDDKSPTECTPINIRVDDNLILGK